MVATSPQSALPPRVAGRLLAVIFGASGTLAAVALLLPTPGTYRAPLLVLNGAVVACGVLAWFAPWERRRWLCFWVFVPAALGFVSVANVVGGFEPYSFAVYFTVPFLWVGVASPRWTSMAVWPVAVIAYVVPLRLLDRPVHEMLTVAYVLPVWLLVAESLAWVVARLHRAEQTVLRANRSTGRLFTAATGLGISVQHPAQAADAIARVARELLGSSTASVLLLDVGDTSLLEYAGGAKDDLLLGGPSVTVSRDLEAHLRQPRVRPVPDHQEPSLRTLLDAVGVDAAALIALRDPDEPRRLHGAVVLGWNASDCEATRPDPDLLERASALLGPQGTRLLQQARNVERLSRDAETDPLTDLANRRKLRTVMDGLGPAGAVALIDLDHFKRVNDRFGHSVGDEVLRDLAGCMGQVRRTGDITARLGGEEFVVVCADGGADAASQAINRLRALWHGEPRLATFSAGIAEMTATDTPAQLLHRADEALYEAKSGGRDQTVIAEPVALAACR